MKSLATLITLLFITATVFAVDFQVKKVSDHVYLAHPGKLTRVNSTSTIIVGSKYLTVIEAQPDIGDARQLIQAIRKNISTLPIRYLVFSHFHLDHVLGAQAFVEENPNITIIAHKNAYERISTKGVAEKEQWLKDLTSIKTNFENQNNKEAAAEIQSYRDDVLKSGIILPNLIVYDSIEIRQEPVTVQIKHIGIGHTNSDLVSYIPEEKVLVTGDLLHDYEPLFWDANPDKWISTLFRLEQFDAKFIIGGHGDLQTGKQVLHLWRNYMTELTGAIKSALVQGQSLDDFKKKYTEKTLTSLTSNNYGERIQSYRAGYMGALPGPLSGAISGNIENLWGIYSKK